MINAIRIGRMQKRFCWALSELLAGQNTSGDIYCDQLKPIFYEIANIFEAVIG